MQKNIKEKNFKPKQYSSSKAELARRLEQKRISKRQRRGKIEPCDPKFVRLKLLDKLIEEHNDKDYPHEIIDEIYQETRVAVDNEIKQID